MKGTEDNRVTGERISAVRSETTGVDIVKYRVKWDGGSGRTWLIASQHPYSRPRVVGVVYYLSFRWNPKSAIAQAVGIGQRRGYQAAGKKRITIRREGGCTSKQASDGSFLRPLNSNLVWTRRGRLLWGAPGPYRWNGGTIGKRAPFLEALRPFGGIGGGQSSTEMPDNGYR